MDIVEVDIVQSEPRQALLDGLPAVFGGRIYLDAGRVRALDSESELGGKEDVTSSLRVDLEPLANNVLAVSICVGGVPVTAAYLPCAIKKLQAILVGPG